MIVCILAFLSITTSASIYMDETKTVHGLILARIQAGSGEVLYTAKLSGLKKAEKLALLVESLLNEKEYTVTHAMPIGDKAESIAFTVTTTAKPAKQYRFLLSTTEIRDRVSAD